MSIFKDKSYVILSVRTVARDDVHATVISNDIKENK